MNGFDDDFLIFLKTNYPTDFYKVCSPDAKPEDLTFIHNNHSAKFSVWMKVPESIRIEYGGIVPSEIMDMAARGDTEALKRVAYDREPPKENDDSNSFMPTTEELLAAPIFAHAFALGYSKEASLELSAHRLFRDSLRDKALHNTLSESERMSWRLSRTQDKETIRKDWCKNQPEKMLLHLFAKYNRGKISTEEFMPQAADLMKQIDTEGRRGKLLEYIQSKPIQAKLAHFHADVLDTLSQTVLHKLPQDERDDYLRASIPLKTQMRRLIAQDNRGVTIDLAKSVQDIVKQAQKDKVGLDLSGYTEDSHHPMSAKLRQMFMVACCVNNVAYRSPAGEKINLNSDYVKSLPQEVQTLIASRSMKLAKESMIKVNETQPGKAQKSQLHPATHLLKRNTRIAY